MSKAVKYLYDTNPLYVYLKRHYCPKCSGVLKTKYYSKIVNSNSPEAKDYDFSLADTYLVGDVEFRTKLFYCPTCGFEISFYDMKVYEKKNKKNKQKG